MSKIFAKILCPVAFDQNSDAAIEFAYELAQPNMTTLYLLHVVSVPTMEAIMLKPNPILTEGIASRELEKLAQRHLLSDVSYRIIIRTGDPAMLIVAVAEEIAADLIVMPTHGRRGLVHMMTGASRAGRPRSKAACAHYPLGLRRFCCCNIVGSDTIKECQNDSWPS